jgi:pre-mRNA-processing factor 8
MKYGLVLGNPKDFYNEIHRASHFIKFIRTEDKEQLEEVDHEDYYN